MVWYMLVRGKGLVTTLNSRLGSFVASYRTASCMKCVKRTDESLEVRLAKVMTL